MSFVVDCIIGIDVGKSGGISIYKPNSVTQVIKMPDNLMDLKEFFEYQKEISGNVLVFLEKQQRRPTDNEHFGKSIRVDALLQDYERLKTILEFAQVPFALVHPRKWQVYLNLDIKRKKGDKPEEYADRKRRFRDVAQSFYPDIKVALWNADSLLITYFGRHILMSDPNWVKANVPKTMHDKLKLF